MNILLTLQLVKSEIKAVYKKVYFTRKLENNQSTFF